MIFTLEEELETVLEPVLEQALEQAKANTTIEWLEWTVNKVNERVLWELVVAWEPAWDTCLRAAPAVYSALWCIVATFPYKYQRQPTIAAWALTSIVIDQV